MLSSASQFRPGPPPAPESAERAAEIAEVKNFKRTPITNGKVFYWQFGQYAGPGADSSLSDEVGRRLAEFGLDRNAAASGARLRAGACRSLRWLDRLAGREVPLLDGATQSVRSDHHHGRPEPQLPNLRVERGDPRHGSYACARLPLPARGRALPRLGAGVRGIAALGGDPFPQRYRIRVCDWSRCGPEGNRTRKSRWELMSHSKSSQVTIPSRADKVIR